MAFLTRNIIVLNFVFSVSAPVFAQADKDSVMKELVLKEVHIHDSGQGKSPKTSFYQSSTLSNTEDILSRIEGVSLVRRGPIGMEPVLRAFSAGQINVVIDGMRIFGACTDKMDPATIYTEPVNLKSIDVQYGGDGIGMGGTVGGSLNMKLAEALVDSSKTFSGSLASGYYSAAEAVQNIMTLRYSADRWAFRLSGVYRKAGNYRDGADQTVAFSQYEKANVSLSSTYKLNPGSSVKADFLLDNGWDIGYPALPMDVGHARARIGALTYKKENFGGLLRSLETKVYANSIRHAMDDTQRPLVAMHMDMPGRSNTQGAFVEMKAKSLGKHHLTLKIDGYHNTVVADMTMYPADAAPMYMLTWPENKQIVAGLYIQDEIFLNAESRLQLKARMDVSSSKVTDEMGKDQFSVFGYDISDPINRTLKNFNIGYTRYLNSFFTLYASAGYNERIPTTSERFGFYLYNRMDNHDYIGNPFLKNERAQNLELNLIFAKNDFSWKLSGYTSLMQDYILGKSRAGLSIMTPGAAGVRAYENIPSANIYGGESNLNYQFAKKHVMLNSNLKWVRGVDDDGASLPLISPIKGITSLRFVHKGIFIQLENELSLKQSKISGEYGETPTPGYSIFNIRANYGMKVQRYKLDISLGAENVFDKDYYEHLDWGKLLRPGRNIYTMLALNF